MSNFSAGTVKSKDESEMKFFIQTGWRPDDGQFHPNEGLNMLGDPQVFEATPEELERVLYRYQLEDVAASPELTFEIVRAYITAREHNSHKKKGGFLGLYDS